MFPRSASHCRLQIDGEGIADLVVSCHAGFRQPSELYETVSCLRSFQVRSQEQVTDLELLAGEILQLHEADRSTAYPAVEIFDLE